MLYQMLKSISLRGLACVKSARLIWHLSRANGQFRYSHQSRILKYPVSVLPASLQTPHPTPFVIADLIALDSWPSPNDKIIDLATIAAMIVHLPLRQNPLVPKCA